jgi:hypothetical protein
VPGGNVARLKRLLGQFICTLLIVAFVLHYIWWIVGAGAAHVPFADGQGKRLRLTGARGPRSPS